MGAILPARSLSPPASGGFTMFSAMGKRSAMAWASAAQASNGRAHATYPPSASGRIGRRQRKCSSAVRSAASHGGRHQQSAGRPRHVSFRNAIPHSWLQRAGIDWARSVLGMHSHDKRGRDGPLRSRKDWHAGRCRTLGRAPSWLVTAAQPAVFTFRPAGPGPALGRELLKIRLEIFALPNAQLAQITPSKYPRVVHVIEVESHRIIADRDYIQDGYIALAADRLAFRAVCP